MNCAHQALDDTILVVNNLCKWCQAIGRAGCVGDLVNDIMRLGYVRLRHTYHRVFGFIRVKVNATDIHRGVGRRRGDDDLLSAALQMG